MSYARSFGIDFGTTNSSVVHYGIVGMTDTFTSFGEEDMPVPSVVAIDRLTGEVHAGREAWSRRAELESSCECVSSIKTLLGDERWSKQIAGVEWHVVDIAGEVFAKLKDVAAEQREQFRRATLAIPIGLGPSSRRMLRMAASYADIEVEEFVSESTAAFFAYYDELKSAQRVAVFDWGGGTLDVSILSNERGSVTELATEGMDYAGDKIDEELARKIHGILAREKGVSITFDEVTAHDRDALVVRCENAKRALSGRASATVNLNQYGGMGAVRYRLDRGWFEGLVAPIVDNAIGCLDKAINESGWSDAGIDRVVLVGGTSNLMPLRKRMRERFGEKLFTPEDAVWSVSRGAAVLSRFPGSYVAAQDVGVILADGTYYGLLRKGEVVKGWKKAVEFGVTDATDVVRVVFSGSADIDSSESRFRMKEVPGYGFLEEKLIFEAEVDSDLVFRVRMRSNMRRNLDDVVWEYDKLKLSYGYGGGAL